MRLRPRTTLHTCFPHLFVLRFCSVHTAPPGSTISRGAASPYFRDGGWEWRRCSVLGYLPEHKLFDVQFLVSGHRKRVRRLNLMFMDALRDDKEKSPKTSEG